MDGFGRVPMAATNACTGTRFPLVSGVHVFMRFNEMSKYHWFLICFTVRYFTGILFQNVCLPLSFCLSASLSVSHSLSASLSLLFQQVLHDWCNKGCGMSYPVCGMMHIKVPLLLIRKSSLCSSSSFLLTLSEWYFNIHLTQYNHI